MRQVHYRILGRKCERSARKRNERAALSPPKKKIEIRGHFFVNLTDEKPRGFSFYYYFVFISFLVALFFGGGGYSIVLVSFLSEGRRD